MKDRIKNHIRCISYLLLIMLLLLSSLPLSGVFAEVSQGNVVVEEPESEENVCKEEAESEKNVCEEDSELAENVREDESEDIENTSEEELDTVESEQEHESESAEGTWEQDDEQVDEIESTQEGTEEPESTQEEKSQIQLQASIEKEGHFSYREDYGRSVLLSFFCGRIAKGDRYILDRYDNERRGNKTKE